MTTIIRKAALAFTGLAATTGAVVGPIAAPALANDGAHAAPAERHSAVKELDVQYKAQENYYYCGPASTRIALSAQDKTPSQDEVARHLGTTENGTNSAEDTTRVLEDLTGEDYETTTIPDQAAAERHHDELQSDITETINDERAVVINIAGTVVDTDGVRHSYPGGHYVAVVGYRDGGEPVKIADPAKPDRGTYWVDVEQVAEWIATRGYSH